MEDNQRLDWGVAELHAKQSGDANDYKVIIMIIRKSIKIIIVIIGLYRISMQQ